MVILNDFINFVLIVYFKIKVWTFYENKIYILIVLLLVNITVVAQNKKNDNLTNQDDSLITFIKSNDNPTLIKEAIKKLKMYTIVDVSKIIPWANLPTVYSGSATSGGKEFPCGINFLAFSLNVEEQYSSSSLIVGLTRYYKPNTASLYFRDWTEFDGHIVKCSNESYYNSYTKCYFTTASIKKDGLFFESSAIVLKKIAENKSSR